MPIPAASGSSSSGSTRAPAAGAAHPGDAGADLFAAADVELAPGQRAVVPTGMAIALPDGYAAFVHPRSGLAARHGVTIVNAPGTVDAGYRGEIRVTLLNTDPAERRPVPARGPDRPARHPAGGAPVFHEVETLPGSARASTAVRVTGGHAAAGQPRSAARRRSPGQQDKDREQGGRSVPSAPPRGSGRARI